MDTSHAVKAVEGYLGNGDDVATLNNAVFNNWRKLVDNSGGKAVCFVNRAAAVLEAAVDADKQLIAGKGVHPAIIAHNAPRTAVRG